MLCFASCTMRASSAVGSRDLFFVGVTPLDTLVAAAAAVAAAAVDSAPFQGG